MPQWVRSELDQIMAYRLFNTKPLSEVLNQCWYIINWPLGNKLQWNLNWNFAFKKLQLKMSSGKWRPFCLVLNVLSWVLMLILILIRSTGTGTGCAVLMSRQPIGTGCAVLMSRQPIYIMLKINSQRMHMFTLPLCESSLTMMRENPFLYLSISRMQVRSYSDDIFLVSQ